MARKPNQNNYVVLTYKIGHVVILRTGGPEMVIESIEPNGELNCIWFNIRGVTWEPPYRDRFKPFTVDLAEYCDPDDPEAEYLATEMDEPTEPPPPPSRHQPPPCQTKKPAAGARPTKGE